MRNLKNEQNMLNPLTKLQLTMKLLATMLLALVLLNACATKTPEIKGAIKAMKVVKPAEATSEETVTNETETSESSEEALLSDSELGDDVSSAPIRERKLEMQPQESDSYDNTQSSYQLPPAKARRKQPEADSEFKNAYKDALREMDKALGSNKNFSEAQRMFEELEKQNPTFSGPRTNIGMIYLHQQEYAKAAESFTKALEINNENEYALSNLALTYRELGKFLEAKESYQKAIELNPNDPLPHYNLGILAELYLRDLPLAIQSFEHYKIANRKKDPEVDNWLIDLNNRLKQQQQAAAQAQQAAQQSLDPATGLPMTQPANGEATTGEVPSEQAINEKTTGVSETVAQESAIDENLPAETANPPDATEPENNTLEQTNPEATSEAIPEEVQQ